MKRRIDSPSDNTISAKKSGRHEPPEEIIRSSEADSIDHICTSLTNLKRNHICKALNTISSKLGGLSVEAITQIENRLPGTIRTIAAVACKDHAHALNAISSKLGGLSAEAITQIENKLPGTIKTIVGAACKKHVHALNAISSQLGGLSMKIIIEIENKSPGTIKMIAGLVCKDKDHAHALNAISSQLGGLSAQIIIEIENKAAGTIRAIAGSALTGHPHALNAISSQLARLTVQDIESIEGACPETLKSIVCAAGDGFGCALDALSSKWGQLSLPCIESVAAKAPQEITVPLVEAARMGYETALIATIKKLSFANATTPNTHGRLSRLTEGLETAMIDHFNYEKREKKFGKKLWLLRVFTEAGLDNLSLDDYFITRAKKYSVALTWYKDIQVCAGSDNSPDKKIIEYVKDSLLIFCAEEEERKCRSHFLRELIDYYASLQKSYVINQHQGILSDKYSRLQVWTNMLDKMDCSSLEDTKIAGFLNNLDECWVEYNAGINQGRPENSFDNIKKRFLQPRQESGQGFFSRITGEQRQEMRWHEQYAMLQEMLAVLGCYIQTTEGATLISAQQEMKDLFAHWVYSCSDLADVSLDDISYQDLKTLLRNYDYGQAKDLLKAGVGSADMLQEHANSVTP